MGHSEPGGSVAGEQDVVGAIEQMQCDSCGVSHSLECRDAGSGVGGPVHHGRVEFDLAVFVGQAPVADGRFVRVVFNEFDSGDDGIDEIKNMIGAWKNDLILPPEALEKARNPREQTAAIVYTHYQRTLKAFNAVDFDDLILLPVRTYPPHIALVKATPGQAPPAKTEVPPAPAPALVPVPA